MGLIPTLVSVHWLHSSLFSGICMGNSICVVAPAGAPARWVTPAEEECTQRGIRTDGQAEDNTLLNSAAQNLSPGMLKKLILMLAGTKLLQTGSHVCMPQRCCPQGWSGGHRRRCALQRFCTGARTRARVLHEWEQM